MSPAGGGRSATLPAMLASSAERFADGPAVVDGDGVLRYDELVETSRRFGSALVASGVAPGDRVAVWAPNSARWVVGALGIFQAAAVLVPLNTRYRGPEAVDILRRSRATLLVTVDSFLGTDYLAMLEATGADLPHLTGVVLAQGAARPGAASWSAFMARATAADRSELDRRSAAVRPDAPSDILFTSGTTGAPKGVVQTHERTLSVATDWVAMTGLGPGDRYLMVNPYFHMFGLKAGILAACAAGATMLPEARFDVERVLSVVAAAQVTVLPGPPTLYQSILDHPHRERHDLSTLRVAVTGAADIPVELIRRMDAELPFSTIVTGYGLTEGGTAAATSRGDDVEVIATTVGRPRPGFEVRIVDPAGRAVPGGEAGEILLRGRSVMSHYLDDPEATAQALSADGWLRTGDLGLVDGAGRLRIVGRLKDMFLVGGFNAYPAEIEQSLRRHPDIAEAGVVGLPDQRLGEVGMAFVVLRPGGALTPSEVVAWSRGEMANFKVPRAVEVVDELPRNAAGKVEKTVLRQWATDRRAPRSV